MKMGQHRLEVAIHNVVATHRMQLPYKALLMSLTGNGPMNLIFSLWLRNCAVAMLRHLTAVFLPVGQVQAINESNKFEAEIRQEQEAKKKQAEEQKQRRAAFKELQSAFK